jgi:hypothetical protein
MLQNWREAVRFLSFWRPSCLPQGQRGGGPPRQANRQAAFFSLTLPAIVLPLVLCSACVQAGAPTATPSSTLTVEILSAVDRGMAPPPGTPLPTPAGQPFLDVTVRVARADAPAVAVGEQRTTGQGLAAFTLFPGHYWVYVPSGDPTALSFCGPVRASCGIVQLPDLQPVYAFQDVTLSRGQSATLTLTIRNRAAP